MAVKSGSMEKKYILPRLIDYQGDLSRSWYIVYYAINPDTGELVRKRYDKKLNKISTKAARYQYAAQVMIKISSLLKQGYHAKAKQKPEKWAGKKLSAWFESFMQAQQTKISANYMQQLRLVAGRWAEFETKNRIRTLGDVGKAHLQMFLDAWQAEKAFGPKTYNAYRAILHRVLGELVNLEELKGNVAAGVTKKKVITGAKNLPYSLEQVRAIREEAGIQGKKQLLLFIDFCLYTLARPRKELHLLRVNELGDKAISIPANRGKTGARMVPIAAGLGKIISREGLKNYSGDFYVFAHGGKPGTKPYTSTHFYDQLIDVLQALKLDGKGYNLYSFKHTGAVMAYQAGIPVHIIQIMCGHSSPTQTEQYLKNLGLISPADPYMQLWPEI
jgi:integrase